MARITKTQTPNLTELQNTVTQQNNVDGAVTGLVSAGLDQIVPGSGQLIQAYDGLVDSMVPEDNRVARNVAKYGKYGVVGSAIGLYKGIKEQKQYNDFKGLAEDKAKRDTFNNGLMNNYEQTNQILEAGMQYMGGTKAVEVERDELIFNKDWDLVADFRGGKSHKQGGEDYVAQEGDIIFPGKLRDKVLGAYGKGNFKQLEKMRKRLPRDKAKKYARGVYGITTDPPDSTSYYSVVDSVKAGVVAPPLVAPDIFNSPPLGAFYDPNKAIDPNAKMMGTEFMEGYTPSSPKPKVEHPQLNRTVDQIHRLIAPDKTPAVNNPQSVNDFMNTLVQSPSIVSKSTNTNQANGLTDPAIVGGDLPVLGKALQTANKVAARANSGTSSTPKVDPVAVAYANRTNPAYINTNPGLDGTISKPAAPTLKDATVPEIVNESEGDSQDNSFDVGGFLKDLGGLSGTINNFVQATKKPETVQENFLQAEKIKYKDRSNSARRRAKARANAARNNARNLSGGSAANYRANSQQANAEEQATVSQIDEREMQRADQIDAINNQIENQTRQINSQKADIYADQNARNRAIREQYLNQGFADLTKYSQMQQLMENQAARDAQAKALIEGATNYATDEDGNRIFVGPRIAQPPRSLRVKRKTTRTDSKGRTTTTTTQEK